VLIKRYANRKLYNTETSSYITLRGVADLLEQGQDVKVVDNETGEDITSVTLSQILVDTERGGRDVPGSLLSELARRGGDALYSALRRGVGDASGSFEELQHSLRRLLERGSGRNWIAFTPPDFEKMVQRSFERVAELVDLPRRSDIRALTERLDRLITLLENREPPRSG